MIREYKFEKAGVVIASSEYYEATVDEVIEFLEKHRGKRFWNGAAGDVSFYADDELVRTDELKFWFEEYWDELDEEINGRSVADFAYYYLKEGGEYPNFDEIDEDDMEVEL